MKPEHQSRRSCPLYILPTGSTGKGGSLREKAVKFKWMYSIWYGIITKVIGRHRCYCVVLVNMQSKAKVTFEDRLPVRPRKKWDKIEQYVEYLRHFAAYKYVEKFVESKSALEVGCGTGYGANYLSQFASNVLAIDISKGHASYGHVRYKKGKLTFLQASGLSIPLKDSSIDVAVSFQVIEHIEPNRVVHFLSEIKRTLKDESILVITTPNKELRLLPFQKPRNPEHKKEYGSKELKRILGDVFEEVKVYGLKGSEQIQSIVQNQLKQSPLTVYIIIARAITKPITPLIRKILPYMIISQIEKMRATFRSKGEKITSITNKTTERVQVSNFEILAHCPKDCLDLYGVCKKTKTRIGVMHNE